jgi:pullulanase
VTADLPRLPALHQQQLVLVQEDAAGRVQNATTAQMAGALDDLYAAAAGRARPGRGGGRRADPLQALGAHGAERVGGAVRRGSGSTLLTRTTEPMTFDPPPASGSSAKPGNLQGATTATRCRCSCAASAWCATWSPTRTRSV